MFFKRNVKKDGKTTIFKEIPVVSDFSLFPDFLNFEKQRLRDSHSTSVYPQNPISI